MSTYGDFEKMAHAIICFVNLVYSMIARLAAGFFTTLQKNCLCTRQWPTEVVTRESLSYRVLTLLKQNSPTI